MYVTHVRKGRLLVAVLAVISALGASSASARVQDCSFPSPNAGEGPRNDHNVPLGNLSARNMSCAAARASIRNGYMTRHGFKARGFYCYVISQFATPGPHSFVTGQTIRCISGPRAFRFSWAT